MLVPDGMPYTLLEREAGDGAGARAPAKDSFPLMNVSTAKCLNLGLSQNM